MLSLWQGLVPAFHQHIGTHRRLVRETLCVQSRGVTTALLLNLYVDHGFLDFLKRCLVTVLAAGCKLKTRLEKRGNDGTLLCHYRHDGWSDHFPQGFLQDYCVSRVVY